MTFKNYAYVTSNTCIMLVVFVSAMPASCYCVM